MSTANIIAEFEQAMQAVGLVLDKRGVIDDGKAHPCQCAHDKGSKKSGRYYLHSDGIANGAFGCYHESENGLTHKWQSEHTPPLSEAERKAYAQKMAQAEAERAQQTANDQAQAKAAVQAIWDKAKDASTANAYVTRKGIHPLGCKVFGDADTLIVPIYDGKPAIENLCNAQFIQADGTKRFKTGGKKKGCYCAIGNPESRVAVLCEGFATGASIAQATGYYVLVAFDAGNLLPVAERIKAALPMDWRLIIAGDNDAYGEANTGADKARACAHAVGAECVLPDFTGCEITHAPTDFNDLHQLAGLEAVKAQIDGAGVLSTAQVQAVQDKAAEAETDDQTIARMAGLSKLDFARQSKAAADKLGISVSQLRGVVNEYIKAQNSGFEAESPFEVVEAWEEPVSGAQVLNEVLAQLQAHVIADAETLHTAALWVALTWFMDAATIAPIALITAPEKNCGKSTLLVAMSKMAKSPLVTANMSSAVLFRLIDQHAPTLFIDEVDTWLRDNEELRGILNAGHTKDTAYVWRCEGDNFTPTKFSVWGAKALSGISAQNISDTLKSRSVILTMRRKLKGETALNVRHTPVETFTIIKRQLARWADDNASAFSAMRPIMEGLNNRDQDNYEPLLAIAMLAGGDWVTHLERACGKAQSHSDDSKSIGEELLEACRNIFDSHKMGKIKSVDLLKHLLEDEEAPFATYNRGKPITIKQISTRLSGFGIRSKTIRFGYEGTAKGYEREQFNDVFTVYLDGEKDEKNNFSSIPPILSVTSSQLSTGAGLDVTHEENVTVTKTPKVTLKPSTGAGCDDVTHRTPPNGENLKNQPNVRHKRGFTNAVIEAEKQSNSIGISDEELFKQFEREFMKTGTGGNHE